MLSVRPKIAELSFQLFGRSLHPELFDFHRSKIVQRDAYQAEIAITNSGHVISWCGNEITLNEVASSSHQPLPRRRVLVDRQLKGSQSEQVRCRRNVYYDTKFTLESMDPELFWAIQKQLTTDSTEGLLHRFDSSGRIALGAISYIHVDTRAKSMLVQAIHTFPDDHAIVKVESSFGIGSPKV